MIHTNYNRIATGVDPTDTSFAYGITPEQRYSNQIITGTYIHRAMCS